jgi:5-methylcytosine-specific restriction protein A
MPSKPLRPCNHFGCHNLVSSGYCNEHSEQRHEDAKQKQKMYDAQRPSPSARGYNAQWVRASQAYLRRNPVCAICKVPGLRTKMCVDHIIPHKGDMKLFWDIENWQSLCRHCHSQKTMKELNEIKRLRGGV